MKHVIAMFDAETEKLIELVELPANRKKDLSDLMGWQAPEDEIYDYNLSPQQFKVLEIWTGRTINSTGRIAQLACIAD